jgi:hypothetical protein
MDAFESHTPPNSGSEESIPVLVLVDANNVRRSAWPNISGEELVERCAAWANRHDHEAAVVFDGPVSADDRIAAQAAELRAAGRRFWLVTSDRALRAEAGEGAERRIGGGAFLRELLGA